MGCGSSSERSWRRGSCRLMSSKLTFTKEQLQALNGYFRDQLDAVDSQNDLEEREMEGKVEKLVQRLILGAADLDRRFSSMFLVSLNEPRRMKRLRFEYLLRIDGLSAPAVNGVSSLVTVEEDEAVPGFVRLKVHGESWQEYVDIGGRLRRDLVKAKLATLLATTIKQEAPSQSDEKKSTMTPGQVVDAAALDRILKQQHYSRVFYGAADCEGELARRQRVALIEDAAGILLRIGLEGCKTREIEVRLLIGIGLPCWSNLADYPRRVPLYHCDALLHYSAAQSGMYAVAGGAYIGARCENRASLWRIRVPAAEKIMNEHYADDSVAALTDSVLIEILYQLRDGRFRGLRNNSKESRSRFSGDSRERLRVVSRHILRTIHRWSLERAGPDPLSSWAPDSLSRHVLLALDELLRALTCQNLRCYFHPRCNLMLQSTRGGALHHEDSYASDARVLQSYLMALHQHSSRLEPRVPPLPPLPPSPPSPLDVMAAELIVKWRGVMASLPRATLDADYGYSPKQLHYLDIVLREVLSARDSSLQDQVDECSCLSYNASEQVENLVYLVRLVLRQARDQVYLAKDPTSQSHRRSLFKKCKHYNTTSHFEHSVDRLVDLIRRDTETGNVDLEREPFLARTLLHWLYLGLEEERKILEQILRPYLGSLFNGLQEYCYYADSWRERRDTWIAETRSLGRFCKLVATQKLSPADGLVDFLSEGWRWAESLIRMIERSSNSLRLIFLVDGRIIKYNLTFAGDKSPSTFSTWSKARTVAGIMRRRRSTSYRYNLHQLPDDNGIPGHVELRNLSPLTYVASMARAHLRLRGPADLVSAVISLGKFTILQEVAAILPREQSLAMLDMIRRAAKETSRRIPRPANSHSHWPNETYTPRLDLDLLDAPSCLVGAVNGACVIAERQRQLELELQGMQDTLRTNVFPKPRTSLWDGNSLASWTSSLDSAGTIPFRRHRLPIWQAFRKSPMRGSPLGERKKLEMISREESPNWSIAGNRRRPEESKEEDRLPSWETLESALNEQLCSFRLPGSPEPEPEPEPDRIVEQTYLHTITGPN